MATHSSILDWKIPWTEEPGGLKSMGLQRVRHDLETEHKHTQGPVFTSSDQNKASTEVVNISPRNLIPAYDSLAWHFA